MSTMHFKAPKWFDLRTKLNFLIEMSFVPEF